MARTRNDFHSSRMRAISRSATNSRGMFCSSYLVRNAGPVNRCSDLAHEVTLGFAQPWPPLWSMGHSNAALSLSG
jgi:hypothetical protein